jgi:hypothetical protein
VDVDPGGVRVLIMEVDSRIIVEVEEEIVHVEELDLEIRNNT